MKTSPDASTRCSRPARLAVWSVASLMLGLGASFIPWGSPSRFHSTVVGYAVLIYDVFLLGVPAWLIFYPPCKVRGWSSWFRPVLAFLVAWAGIGALFYGFVYPEIDATYRAFEKEDPNSTILIEWPIVHIMPEPGNEWRPVIRVTAFFFVTRGICLVCVAGIRWVISRPMKRQHPG